MLNRMSENRAGIRDRRGVALMTVIVATVVVGVMATGAVFVGMQEQRMGEGVRRVGKSFGIAEGGDGARVGEEEPGAAASAEQVVEVVGCGGT